MDTSPVIYNPQAVANAERRLRESPQDLDAADIAQLRIWGGDLLAAKAIERRSKAMLPPPTPAPRPVARLDVDAIATELIAVISQALAPLAARIAALEQRPALKYAGVFGGGNVYEEGMLATDRGSLWLSVTRTSARPGDNQDWRLIVKRGEAER
jgi:hypothetical protein